MIRSYMEKLDRFDGVQQTIHEPVGGIFQKERLSRSAAQRDKQRENGGNEERLRKPKGKRREPQHLLQGG